MNEIRGRGKAAIIVGGTGLYIKSIIDEMNFPETDPALRKRLEDEAELLGAAELYSRLRVLDPSARFEVRRERFHSLRASELQRPS